MVARRLQPRGESPTRFSHRGSVYSTATSALIDPPKAGTWGEAQILEVGDIPVSVFERLPRGKESDPSVLDRTAIIRIVPRGEFVTYGIAMPINQVDI